MIGEHSNRSQKVMYFSFINLLATLLKEKQNRETDIKCYWCSNEETRPAAIWRVEINASLGLYARE